MNIESAIDLASKKFKKRKIKTPLLDSEILMSKALSKSREYIMLNLNMGLNENNYIHFNRLVEERLKGKPIAYLTGVKSFWKYEFDVNENVLIPRPETELIIGEILKIYKNKPSIHFLDIGIGSGCILLSILKEKKNFFGTGIDISKECIKVTKNNANKLGLKRRIKLFKTDVDNFDFGK